MAAAHVCQQVATSHGALRPGASHQRQVQAQRPTRSAGGARCGKGKSISRERFGSLNFLPAWLQKISAAQEHKLCRQQGVVWLHALSFFSTSARSIQDPNAKHCSPARTVTGLGDSAGPPRARRWAGAGHRAGRHMERPPSPCHPSLLHRLARFACAKSPNREEKAKKKKKKRPFISERQI